MALASSGSGAVASAQDGDGGGELQVSGSLRTRYRHRWTNNTTDIDVYSTLSLDIGDPEHDKVTGYVLGRVAKDLDGETDNTDFFVFDSIQDTYSDSLKGRLYEAYVDVHRVEDVKLLRFGRQTVYRTPEVVHFDGGRLELPEKGALGFQAGAYAGVPVARFISAAKGDAVFGSYVQLRPWSGGRVRVDWMHLDDEARLGTQRDDLLAVGVWHAATDKLDLHGRYTRLEETGRDVLMRGTYYDSEQDLMVQGSYFELLAPQRQQLSVDVDPFASVLQTYEPYQQASLLVSKGIDDKVTVDGGVDSRRVTDNTDIGKFNRDFDRFHVTCAIDDCCYEGMTLGLTGELWRSGAADVGSWGLDVSRQIDDQMSVSAGTYYSLYKYDFYTVDERDDVRTYFVKVGYQPDSSWQGYLRYEFEDDDFDNYHVLTAGATWRF